MRRRGCNDTQLSNHKVALDRSGRNKDDRDRNTPRKPSTHFSVRDAPRCLSESINRGSFLPVSRILSATDAWIYFHDRTGATDSKNLDVMPKIEEPGPLSNITQG